MLCLATILLTCYKSLNHKTISRLSNPFVTLTLACALIITSCGGASTNAKNAQASTIETPTTDVIEVYNEKLAQIYAETIPSVVKLNIPYVQSEGKMHHHYGSGLVWDTDGHIITNAHLVRNLDRLNVIFANAESRQAEVIARHPLADLAVLKIDQIPMGARPAKLAQISNLQVGQLTVAIGAPFEQAFTMTRGIVSALNRTMRPCKECYPIPDMIQTDASLNPGNSGGPLLNHEGEVIGINTIIISEDGSNIGLGFAIEIGMVQEVVAGLIETQ